MNPIQLLQQHPGSFFAVLDGPCAAGKSTLAAFFKQCIPNLYIVHMDDYYIPMCQKTPDRLSVPGGNADAERLLQEVLRPYWAGRDALVRPYLCHEDRYLPSWTLPAGSSLLLEGSYSGLPELSSCADYRFYITIDEDTQRKRLLERNGPDGLSQFLSRWIPLENHYRQAYHLPCQGWLVIDQTEYKTILKG